MLADLITISGAVGRVSTTAQRAVGSVSALATVLSGGRLVSDLRVARLGGVPFAVLEVRSGAGRRNAVHEYPFRDDAWVEDLGKQARWFEVTGLLVDNSVLYGGGSVQFQREAILAAVENSTSLTLVHPTLGEIRNCNALSFELYDSVELAGASEFRVRLMVSGEPLYPTTVANGAGLALLVTNAEVAAAIDFAQRAADAVSAGAAVAQQVLAVGTGFGLLARQAVGDARRFVGAVSTLAGEFGRYFGGGNAGFSARKTTAGATIAGLLAADAAARDAVTGAIDVLTKASAADPSGYAAATKGVTSAVQAACADPQDALRVLRPMAAYTVTPLASTAPVAMAMEAAGSAAAALFRRSSIAAMATAVQRYQPTSLDDAVAVRNTVTQLIEDEIVRAADRGDDSSFEALRRLRQGIVADLSSRSEGLAALRDWSFDATLPALALAQRMYRDPARADELVRQADPKSPNFMPKAFRALAR